VMPITMGQLANIAIPQTTAVVMAPA
jgi:hypothetical protein